jgi:hypothetical protein
LPGEQPQANTPEVMQWKQVTNVRKKITSFELPGNGEWPMCLHAKHCSLNQGRADVIRHPKAPCGVTGTAKGLKVHPPQKL